MKKNKVKVINKPQFYKKSKKLSLVQVEKQGLGFEKLVTLFEHTHFVMQARAVRSVDIALVVRNWLFGWYIVEFEKGGPERTEMYGKALFDRLATRLKKTEMKGLSATNLRKCREFYLAYIEIQQTASVKSLTTKIIKKKIQQTMSVESFLSHLHAIVAEPVIEKIAGYFNLGWSHYVTLLTIKNKAERGFYELESINNGWGVRELNRQINSGLYQRLALSRNKNEIKKLTTRGQVVDKPSDIIKSPYILEFTGLEERSSYSEHDLETALINKIEHFLLELGNGFLFEGRQKRFTFDHRHFFVDLVFYNRLLRSYVIIDLKIGDLKHQDIGQMQMYVNYFDRFVKTENENPSVGILLCLTKSDELVELTLPKKSNVYASEYKLILPSKAELKKQLEEGQKDWNDKYKN